MQLVLGGALLGLRVQLRDAVIGQMVDVTRL